MQAKILIEESSPIEARHPRVSRGRIDDRSIRGKIGVPVSRPVPFTARVRQDGEILSVGDIQYTGVTTKRAATALASVIACAASNGRVVPGREHHITLSEENRGFLLREFATTKQWLSLAFHSLFPGDQKPTAFKGPVEIVDEVRVHRAPVAFILPYKDGKHSPIAGCDIENNTLAKPTKGHFQWVISSRHEDNLPFLRALIKERTGEEFDDITLPQDQGHFSKACWRGDTLVAHLSRLEINPDPYAESLVTRKFVELIFTPDTLIAIDSGRGSKELIDLQTRVLDRHLHSDYVNSPGAMATRIVEELCASMAKIVDQFDKQSNVIGAELKRGPLPESVTSGPVMRMMEALRYMDRKVMESEDLLEELSQDPNDNLFGKSPSDKHIQRARTSITRINRRIEASLFKLNEIQEQHDRLKHGKLERIITWLTVPVGVSAVPITIDLGLKALPHLDHHLHSPILASSVLAGISIGAYFLAHEFGKSFARRFLPKERKKIQQINAGSDLIPG